MSDLSGQAGDYLRLRRALGHKLDDAHRLLPRFVAYLDAIGAQTVTVEAALAWARRPDADPASSVWMRRMTVARGFARHMAGVDPGTEVPPPGLVTFRQPFIYSDADIAALMAHARQSIPTPLRAATVETLIGLLATTGMRVGEAIRLERPDVLWAEAVIVVRDSKFGKSRLVPLHESAVAALAAYAGQRDRLQPWPKCPAFFVSTAGTALLYSNVCHTFRKIVDATGVGSPRRPRIHDIRHSFAVSTLVGWYRDGHDVQARLPRLSAVLGHQNPVNTYWYLSAAPELLSLAAARLDTQGPRS
jgi:integrase/recombinase XerD